MATRQNSTNGKPKSPRIQVVLPELIWEQLSAVAETESRTVSNMAKVFIQKGLKDYLAILRKEEVGHVKSETDSFRDNLEKQSIKRLKGAPKRIRYVQKNDNSN